MTRDTSFSTADVCWVLSSPILWVHWHYSISHKRYGLAIGPILPLPGWRWRRSHFAGADVDPGIVGGRGVGNVGLNKADKFAEQTRRAPFELTVRLSLLSAAPRLPFVLILELRIFRCKGDVSTLRA